MGANYLIILSSRRHGNTGGNDSGDPLRGCLIIALAVIIALLIFLIFVAFNG